MEDRRRAERYSGSILEYSFVDLNRDDQAPHITAFVKNLSLTGACVYVNEKIDEGVVLQLIIHLFDQKTPLQTNGRVCWRKESLYANSYDLGIQFIDFSNDNLEKLNHYLNALKKLPKRDVKLVDMTPPLKDGIYKEFYDTGELLSEVSIINGKMQGVKKYYYRTKELLEEVNFVGGKRHGIRRCYSQQGIMRIEQEFVDGQCVRTVKFDRLGHLI